MTREEHHAEALRWLDIAEQAYADIPHGGTLPVVGAAAIAQVHATLAGYDDDIREGRRALAEPGASVPLDAVMARYDVDLTARQR